MWDEFEDDVVGEPVSERPSRRGWIILISVVTIIALLGSSIAGVVWLVQLQRQQPEVVVREQIVPVTATPIPENVESVEEEAVDENGTEDEILAESGVELLLNRIVFVNDSGRMQTIDPYGRNVTQISGSGRIYQFPAWSPNGRYLAAIGSDRTNTSIDVFMDVEDSEPVEVYASNREAPFYLYWSPDSESISFLANHEEESIALHVAPTDGSAESQLLTTGGPFYWTWTGNSEQIFIHTGFSGDDSRLALIDAAGNGDDENIAEPGFFQAPGISADGRFLAYAEETRRGDSRLVIEDTVSGKVQEEDHAGVAALGWSPTGNKLAYISGADPDNPNYLGPLRLVDAEAVESRLLSRDTVFAFFWSPNGRYIAYLSIEGDDGEMNAFLPQLPTRGSRAKPARQFNIPPFSLVVVDVETGEGREVLTQFRPGITFLTQFMPFFDQYALSHRLWSPDSQALVLPILNDDNRSQITIIPTNGGDPRVIADGVSAFWSHQ